MATKRDYYEILGIERGADEAAIKSAFRAQAKKFHPDVNPGDQVAEAKFKEVNEAYEVLSDPQKRARYDQFGHVDPQQGFGGGEGYGGFGGGFGGFGDIGDIFESFFGGSPFGGGGRRANAPVRGDDLRYDLTLSFEEAVFGTKKEIQFYRMENCSACDGSGAKSGTSKKTCPSCNGKGQVQVAQNTAFGRFVTTRTCDQCRGEGTIITEACPDCSGRGRVRRMRKISVSVPAGIANGQAITLRGEGEPGKRGGPPGDLNVHISVRPHKLFTRQEYDLYCDVPVTYGQAALGGPIELPTLEGMHTHKLGEGTQPGTVIRLKNKGVPYLRSNGRGDLYVKINIEVPRRLKDEQKELLRKFEETLDGREQLEQKKSFLDRVKEAFGG